MSRGDTADRAAEREQFLRDDALARQAIRAAADRALGTQPARCCECSLTIPVARRRALPGVKRCIDCQEITDLMRRRQ